jgi:uncharacterized protein (DUF1499 family)
MISESIDEWVSEVPLAQEVNRNEGEKMDLHIVVKTKWMRFADDVFFHIECDGEDVVVMVHSESRTGISDIGLNRQRIEDIRSHLMTIDEGITICS